MHAVEIVILNGISQTHKDKHHTFFSLISGPKVLISVYVYLGVIHTVERGPWEGKRDLDGKGKKAGNECVVWTESGGTTAKEADGGGGSQQSVIWRESETELTKTEGKWKCQVETISYANLKKQTLYLIS